MNDCVTRKWMITQNNPAKHEVSMDYIVEKLTSSKRFVYLCASEEIGLQEETPHFHVFVCFNNVVKMSTLKRWFPFAHFDRCRGTSSECRDYVFKQGKWEKDKKNETNIEESHVEIGEMLLERQGTRTDLEDFISLVESGATDYEIIKEIPRFSLDVDKIQKFRYTVLQEKYKNIFRKLDVTYIWGSAGIGKTSYVMKKYGFDKVYRVTDYKHPFDEYAFQDVLLLDEFRSSLNMTLILNVLDGYPLQLPCRYNNKVACYTKVFIISNVPFQLQYDQLKISEHATYEAWLRRIHHVIHYTDKGMADLGNGHDALYSFHSVEDDCEEVSFNEK